MIVGWALAANLRTRLPFAVLEYDLWHRRGVSFDELVHHSDAGKPRTPRIRYGEKLAEAGILPSIGSVGDSFDDAMAESTIGLLKAELVDLRPYGRIRRKGRTGVRVHLEVHVITPSWLQRRHACLLHLVCV